MLVAPPATLGADAARSLLVRHMRQECARHFIRALSRSSRGAEMKTGTSPRALVFSSGCPERNAVSIATCRHSVMTGVCVRVRVRACVCVHNSRGHVLNGVECGRAGSLTGVMGLNSEKNVSRYVPARKKNVNIYIYIFF